jgi:hypothetical protein
MQHLKGWAVLAAAAGVALAVGPAHAAGFMSEVINEFSLSGPQHAPIDYHERAPLVVPKSIDLPKPEAGNPGIASAAWPKEDDGLTAAEREAANPNIPETERWRYKATHEGQYPISPAELEKGRAAWAEAEQGPAAPNPGVEDMDTRLSRAQLAKGTRKGGEVAAFVGEPTRRRLTDPPVGYRVPSPNAPWGPGREVVKSQRTDSMAVREAADRAVESAGPIR